ncbi:reverse transcriptase [Elysia marginata]|uniref:Reverse transcriptase n=1 Tax=Elysia marginata TaxID=1093978 RepID=A0AAV4G9S7_9GAST|nr:reverse transcriptase [Elysia marginata]
MSFVQHSEIRNHKQRYSLSAPVLHPPPASMSSRHPGWGAEWVLAEWVLDLAQGSPTVKWWSKTEGKGKRDMIINEVRQKEDFRRIQKEVQQPQQVQWTNCDSAIQRSLT